MKQKKNCMKKMKRVISAHISIRLESKKLVEKKLETLLKATDQSCRQTWERGGDDVSNKYC